MFCFLLAYLVNQYGSQDMQDNLMLASPQKRLHDLLVFGVYWNARTFFISYSLLWGVLYSVNKLQSFDESSTLVELRQENLG